MVAEILNSFIEILKLAPRYFFACAAVSAVLIFLPERWLVLLGLDGFVFEYRQWLGLILVMSTVLWGMYLLSCLWGKLNRLLLLRRHQFRVVNRLNSLTEAEKEILRYYLVMGTRTNILRVDDGVVQGLVANHIIYRAASMGDLIEGFAHNITDHAWSYLNAHPEILRGSTDLYRTDKRIMPW